MYEAEIEPWEKCGKQVDPNIIDKFDDLERRLIFLLDHLSLSLIHI